MPQIEIPEEDLSFLRELSREIRTQDNAATASPYYLSVRTYREIILPQGHGDLEKWVNMCSYDTFSSIESARESYKMNGYTYEEVEAAIAELELFGGCEIHEDHNVFFTRKGYEEHMRLNGHNYRYSSDKPHAFIHHATRNPEIRRLLEIIHRLGGEP